MNHYIALLRGINVSGKNKISMPSLKKSFEERGYTNVRTYINSGNVLFSSEDTDEYKIRCMCELLIKDLNVPVLVMNTDTLKESLLNAPKWWGSDSHSVNYAIFILEPKDVVDIYCAMKDVKFDIEKIDHYKRVIFLSAPLATYSKTKWSKIASSSINNDVTIRNANTVRKLVDLIDN